MASGGIRPPREKILLSEVEGKRFLPPPKKKKKKKKKFFLDSLLFFLPLLPLVYLSIRPPPTIILFQVIVF